MMEGMRHYLEVNRFRLSRQANWENFRFTCIDTESTGLDPRKDRLISLAGVGVCQGEVCLWDQFAAVIPVAYNTASVTVHGITRAAAAGGVEEPEAIDGFARWLIDGVIVGHHVQHDLHFLNAACQRHFGSSLRNVVLDTMEAYMAVRARGGFAAIEPPAGHSLDALCECFRIVPHDRHTAQGDAYLTALLLLRVLKEAGKLGLWNLHDLGARWADEPFPEDRGKLP